MAEKKQSDRSGEGVAEAPVKQPRSGWGSKFIWGGLLIAIGVILLLNNLGVVSVELSSFLRLWPVLIIGAGISLLSLRGWLAGLVYGLATIGVIALVWAILVGPFSQQADANTREDFHIARESSSVESAAISLSGGAASFHIGVHGDEDVVRGTLRSDVAELHRFSSVRGTTQQVELELDSQWRLWSGGGNNLDVKLTDQLPIDLSIDSGATSIDADLSAVQLRSLAIDSGASSLKLKLGAELDSSRVDIDTGVSSIKIAVPEQLGVELVFKDGLSSRNVPSDYDKVDDSTYRSPGYDRASKKMTIRVDMGVSSFTLSTY